MKLKKEYFFFDIGYECRIRMIDRKARLQTACFSFTFDRALVWLSQSTYETLNKDLNQPARMC